MKAIIRFVQNTFGICILPGRQEEDEDADLAADKVLRNAGLLPEDGAYFQPILGHIEKAKAVLRLNGFEIEDNRNGD